MPLPTPSSLRSSLRNRCLSVLLPLALAVGGCSAVHVARQALAAAHADRAAFRAFVEHRGVSAMYDGFVAHLRQAGVADVVPPWTLWRQGTDWQRLGEPAFAVPPKASWSEIVPTLRLLRDDVLPATGPVEVVSGYRTSRYNERAGGASGSRHKWFEAVDVIPDRAWERAALHDKLLGIWRRRGAQTRLGLGLYSRTRFHVDTHRHRRW